MADLSSTDSLLTSAELSSLESLLPYASEQELARVRTLLSGSPDPLWIPLPGPQAAALASPADVLGYGGAAGGGKTDLILGLAITQHRRSIIFRREATQGRGLIDRAREILGDIGRINEATGVWRGLPGGRQIEFAGVKDTGDEQKFRGRPHDLVAFDEGDHFTEYQVRFLQGWLRTTVPDQRCRVVIAFNPPATAAGRWLLNYFGPWIDTKHPATAAPGELRWYATLPDGREVERPDGQPFTAGPETITPRSRTFIPSKVSDNPFLLKTGYVGQLQALPEPLRSQLLHGDFAAGLQDDPWQVIPTVWVEAAQARWRSEGHGGRPLTALGVDVARGGADQTVLAPRHGLWFGHLRKYPGMATPDGPAVVELVGQVLLEARAGQSLRDPPRPVVNVDVIGVGSSVYDGCRGRNWNVQPINFASAIDRTDSAGVLTFVNLRAYAYWAMREALDPANPLKLQLPPDPELLADLTAPRWSMLAGGVKIEAKDDLARRIGRSPDCGDAAVLALLMPATGDGPAGDRVLRV
jgi:hypothetical protein